MKLKTLSEKREELFINGKIRECFKDGVVLKEKIFEQDKEAIKELKEEITKIFENKKNWHSNLIRDKIKKKIDEISGKEIKNEK